jgi:hypothetical protein
VVFPGEQNTMWEVEPEILISISAYCSLSQGVDRGSWTAEEVLRKSHKIPPALAIARGESITAWARQNVVPLRSVWPLLTPVQKDDRPVHAGSSGFAPLVSHA